MREGRDLFGQIRVTWPEVMAWCARVARLDPASPRTLDYIRAWNVPAKVAAAKERGEWSDSLAQHAASHNHKERPR